jgi:hypothetical protein
MHPIPKPEAVDQRDRPRYAGILYGAAIFSLVVAHFLFLMSYFEPAIISPGSNGYFLQGHLIAASGRSSFGVDSPLQYVNRHWFDVGGNRYYSHYPPGLPLLLAVGQKIAGATGALLVNPILASLTILMIYMLGALWIGRPWGLFAAAAMAVNPVANEFALSGNSHSAMAFFLVLGLYLLARWAEKKTLARALPAGIVLGAIPAIRYPEAVFGLAVVLFILLNRESTRGYRMSLVGFALGALIPISALAIHNQLAFGAFWKTAYGLTNEQTAFGLEHLRRNALSYMELIQGSRLGLLTGVGVLGTLALCFRRETRPHGLMFLLLIIPTTLLYMSYYWSGSTMRFVLPTFPVYVIAAAWCMRLVTPDRKVPVAVVSLFLIGLVALWGIPRSRQALEKCREIGNGIALVVRAVEENVQEGSILICDNPQVQQNLDWIGRWKLLDFSLLDRGAPHAGRSATSSQDEIGPEALGEERRAEISARYAGNRADMLRTFLADLDEWRGASGKIYWIGNPREISHWIPPEDEMHVVSAIEPPESKAAVPRDQGRIPLRAGTQSLLANRQLAIVEWIRNPAPAGGTRPVQGR